MSTLTDEIARRRTFAIISHPDAGKTTLTEKLLLFVGAIQLAGEVKARGDRRRARLPLSASSAFQLAPAAFRLALATINDDDPKLAFFACHVCVSSRLPIGLATRLVAAGLAEGRRSAGQRLQPRATSAADP